MVIVNKTKKSLQFFVSSWLSPLTHYLNLIIISCKLVLTDDVLQVLYRLFSPDVLTHFCE
jgi:hypothetical protein